MNFGFLFKFIAAALVIGVVGQYVAPPYTYTSEEQTRLKSKPNKWDFVLWQVRAYENWKNCGTTYYCRATRCAALDGGCRPTASEIAYATYVAPEQKEGESSAAWRRRVDAWCKASKPAYESWVEKEERRKETCNRADVAQTQQRGPEPAKVEPAGNVDRRDRPINLDSYGKHLLEVGHRMYCADPRLFLSALAEPNILNLVDGYKAHCR